MTLAQSYLEMGGPKLEQHKNKPLKALVEFTHDFICKRLRAPLSTDEVAADRTAERFVFDEDPHVVVSGLCQSGAVSPLVIFKSTYIPCTNIWVEYPCRYENDVLGRMGFAVGPIPMGDSGAITRLRLMMAMVGQSSDEPPVPLGLVTLPDFPWINEEGINAELHWFLDELAGAQPDTDFASREAKRFVMDFVDAMFLINTPKVCERRVSSFGPRKRKLQEKTGKPLIEFRRMTVKVGVGAPKYPNRSGGGTPDGEGAHRKLHRVMPFFRTYTQGREMPKVAFVPSHWRGDPKLGVIIHDRTMKTR